MLEKLVNHERIATVETQRLFQSILLHKSTDKLARMVSERHFGTGSTGIVDGPGQAKIDIAFSKLRP